MIDVGGYLKNHDPVPSFPYHGWLGGSSLGDSRSLVSPIGCNISLASSDLLKCFPNVDRPSCAAGGCIDLCVLNSSLLLGYEIYNKLEITCAHWAGVHVKRQWKEGQKSEISAREGTTCFRPSPRTCRPQTYPSCLTASL